MSKPTLDESQGALAGKVLLAEVPGLVFLKVTERRGFVPLCSMLLGKPTQNIYVLAGHDVGHAFLHIMIKQLLYSINRTVTPTH